MKNNSGDSLDMLLDAMSNAFGSIVLICLLLVVSTSHTSVKIVEDSIKSKMESIRKVELDNTTKEIVELEEQIKAFEIKKRSDLSKNLTSEIEKNKQLLKQFNELLKKFSKKFKTVKLEDLNLDDINKVSESLEKEQEQLKKLQEEKVLLEKQFVIVKSKATRIKIAPPINKTNSGAFEWIIVRNDSVFFYKNSTSMLKRVKDKTYFIPDFSKGMKTTDGSFEAFVQSFSKNKFMAIIVAKDDMSFNTLRSALKILSKYNVQYFWSPTYTSGYLDGFVTKGGWAPDSTY